MFRVGLGDATLCKSRNCGRERQELVIVNLVVHFNHGQLFFFCSNLNSHLAKQSTSMP